MKGTYPVVINLINGVNAPVSISFDVIVANEPPAMASSGTTIISYSSSTYESYLPNC